MCCDFHHSTSNVSLEHGFLRSFSSTLITFTCKLYNSFVLLFFSPPQALGSSATIRNSHVTTCVLDLRCLEKKKHPGPAEKYFLTSFLLLHQGLFFGVHRLQRTEIRMLETFANEHIFYTSVQVVLYLTSVVNMSASGFVSGEHVPGQALLPAVREWVLPVMARAKS